MNPIENLIVRLRSLQLTLSHVQHPNARRDSRAVEEAIDLINTLCLIVNEERRIATGKTQREWIPVEERLPEEDENVLVCANGRPRSNIEFMNAFCFATYSKTDGWILDDYPEWETPGVTFWMPLPDPPREERIMKERPGQ